MTTQKSDGPIFGTDGIRGRALEGWLSPTAVEALGRAAGAVLSRDSDGSEGAALIAHDGRASAGPLQEALARGVYLNHRHNMFLSLAHTDAVIDEALEATDAAFAALAGKTRD